MDVSEEEDSKGGCHGGGMGKEREVKDLSYYLQRKVYKDEDNYELSDFETKP